MTNPMSIIGQVISASTKITNNPVGIQSILWTNITTAGHLLSLKDKNGNIILPLVADAPGSSGKLAYYVPFPRGLSANGIYCDDLDSGDVYIYISM